MSNSGFAVHRRVLTKSDDLVLAVSAENPETVEQFRALATAVTEARTSLVDIVAYRRLLNGTAGDAVQSVEGAEQALERVQQQVDNAMVILDDDGQRLLREAMEEQRKAGLQSEQLTEMAHEARQTAQQ